MNDEEKQELQLQIKSIGLMNGDSFVLNDHVRMWGMVGMVKNITSTEKEYVVELWSLLEADSPTQYEITIVQISKESVMWVAGGHMYTNGDGVIYQSKEGDHSDEES